MSQEEQQEEQPTDSKFTQATGWGFEAGWGRFFIVVQWVGLANRWQRECTDGTTISYWICLYSHRSKEASLSSLIINPLKISVGLLSKEEEKEETPS